MTTKGNSPQIIVICGLWASFYFVEFYRTISSSDGLKYFGY
jgi:hypothetical protein